jgi:hypothetical protein
MTRNTRYITRSLVAISYLLVISCNKENAPDCLKTSGKTDSEIRQTGPFNRIELRDYIHYELIDSAHTFVEIEGPENLIPKVRTDMDNGLLRISNANTCNFVRSFRHQITVRIYSPEFRNIQNYSTGNITSVNTLTGSSFQLDNRDAAGDITLRLAADTVRILSHTGVADTKVTGHCQTAHLFNQGIGRIDAAGLYSAYTFINNSSINDVHARAAQYLYALIECNGNIYCAGHPPHVDSDIEGNGQLIFVP